MNFIVTSASALTVLHFVLLLVLSEIPSLINAEAVPDGVRLVMKTRSGDTLIRAARGALTPEETVTPAETNVDSQRIRNNRKSNRSQDNFQQAGGHKSGNKKHAAAENGSAVSQQHQQPKHKQSHKNNNNNNNKQQRQVIKQQQHGHHQSHQGGKRPGSKEKATETGASTCRYAKSAWSNCDAKTNMRTRILSLKKEEQNCLPTRTIQKKCKKGCRYEKGTWTQCNAGKMTREDKLQVEGGSDQNCDPVRTVNKKCKGIGSALEGKHHGPNRATKERKQKEKGTRRSSQQQE